MSNTSKVVTAIVIVAIIIALIVWLMGGSSSSTVPVITPTPVTSQTPTQDQSNRTNNGSSLSANATDDASIDGDITQIDAGMNALSSDNASADQGLKDTPVPQAQ